MLRTAKRIKITPNKKAAGFRKGYVKTDEKNSNICIADDDYYSYIFSNE